MKKLIFILIFIILGASGYWAYSEYLQPKYWYTVASFKPPNDRVFNFKPSLSDGVKIKSNKIRLDIIKDANTSIVNVCIIPWFAPISMESVPGNNCAELSGYGVRKTVTIYPTKVDKKQIYTISVEADGPWNATLTQLR